jgi:hypothetical protein
MLDFIIFYIGVGFVLNTALALFNFYRNVDSGYIVVPHPFVWFLTIFSWPKTLWDVIANLTNKDEDKDES